jgi:formylglycine-generating enzyme required for sulfatase activity
MPDVVTEGAAESGEDAPEAGDDASDADADADASDGDADAEAGPEAGCSTGESRCDDAAAVRQVCLADGGWQNQPCTSFCQNGACVAPTSCAGGGDTARCGTGSNQSCCAARGVPGGSFLRSYDGITDYGTYFTQPFPATVSPFVLDVYEVTVSRFRSFVGAYDSWAKPSPGSGSNPNDPDDMGWDPTWNQNLQPTAADLENELACSLSGSVTGTWTHTPGVNELLPITCVDWFTAFAFCVWDGARLPTEAEWNYAAAAGDEQRIYPWSSPQDPSISSSDAVYGVQAAMPVGSAPAGEGKWGQQDLAGNADEWVRDWYADQFPTTNCMDCANLTPSMFAVLRGGSYYYGADEVSASFRDYATPTAGSVFPWFGMRCARSTADTAPPTNDQ